MDESQIVVISLCHASLLENNLRNPNAIRVARAAPWQFAPKLIIPSEEALREGWGEVVFSCSVTVVSCSLCAREVVLLSGFLVEIYY